MSPAAEWLLDNFHMVAAAARDVHHDLPPSFFRKLPQKRNYVVFCGLRQVLRHAAHMHFAPEDLDSIFQPFRSSFDRGTGLGLAIVHRVVTDYNGTIQVSSKVGVGTKVSVRLPAHAGTGGSLPAGDATRRSAVA